MKYWELKQILYENHVDIIKTVHDEYGHEIHTKNIVYCFSPQSPLVSTRTRQQVYRVHSVYIFRVRLYRRACLD